MNGNCDRQWAEHLSRWRIEAPDFDFRALRNRVVRKLGNVLSNDLSGTAVSICRRFSERCGSPPADVPKQVSENAVCVLFDRTDLSEKLLTTDSWEDWVTYVQYVLWSVHDVALGCSSEPASESPSLTDDILGAIGEAIEMTPGAPVVMVISEDSGILLPRGAKLLDKALIDDVLGLLRAHPAVARRYEHALSSYLRRDPPQVRNLLDELRFCLEQLLRDVLKNKKPLEKQKDEVLPWLKQREIHQQIINMFQDILRRFSAYQNDAIKHGEKWSSQEIEFMIYLTGTFMRLLLKLES